MTAVINLNDSIVNGKGSIEAIGFSILLSS